MTEGFVFSRTSFIPITPMSSIFSRIISGEIPAQIEFNDDDIIAIRDINPQAPIHVLIIPKKEIVSVRDVEETDVATLGKLFLVAKQLAEKFDVSESGYRLVVNTGSDAGQTVDHLHVHLLAGICLSQRMA